jgi:hypothetical protein
MRNPTRPVAKALLQLGSISCVLWPERETHGSISGGGTAKLVAGMESAYRLVAETPGLRWSCGNDEASKRSDTARLNRADVWLRSLITASGGPRYDRAGQRRKWEKDGRKINRADGARADYLCSTQTRDSYSGHLVLSSTASSALDSLTERCLEPRRAASGEQLRRQSLTIQLRPGHFESSVACPETSLSVPGFAEGFKYT